MKKLLLCGSLFLLGVACSNYEEFPTPDVPAAVTVEADQSAEPYRVTVDEALAHADRALSRGDKTRSLARRVKSYDYYVAKPATRSLGDTIEVAFHLINYEDNGGFAMIAADERATPVYAYSDSGQLLPEDFVDNPGLAIYEQIAIEGYQAEIASYTPTDFGPITIIPAPGQGPYGDIPTLMIELGPDGKTYYHVRKEDRSSTKMPLLQTAWHQNAPYNDYCSGDKAGCGPIAIAQIMAFHRYPPVVDGRVLDWDNIERNHSLSNADSDDAAYLIHRVGVYAGVTYKPDATSIIFSKVDNTFRLFGYHCTHRQTYNEDTFRAHLLQNKPICMLANKTWFDILHGHVWVVDGYDLDATFKTYYETEPPYLRAMSGYSKWDIRFHINWGWGGMDDGYYYLPDGVTYDEHVRAIYEIYPAEYL